MLLLHKVINPPFEKGGRLKNKQYGLSLLEIMLVMVVASMIMMAAFMYYQSVERNKEINNAIQLIQQIIAAVDNYRDPIDITSEKDGVAFSSTAATDYYNKLNANLVANSGFIPQQYLIQDSSADKGTLGITTPWFGGSFITLRASGGVSDPGKYEIVLNGIPNYACTTLAEQIKSMRDSNAYCETYQSEQVICNGNTLTLENYSVGRMYCPTS